MAKTTVYQIVTDEIISKLESGVIPWRRPWTTFGPPRNLVSGKKYRGINSFLLSLSPHSSPYWLTFKQANQLGGHVRKGERSSIAVFFKDWERDAEDPATGEAVKVKIPILRYYRIFNSEQCEGLDHKRLAEMQALDRSQSFNPIEQAERIVASMPKRPTMTEGGSQAFYRPSDDTVNLPPRGLFDSPDSFYSTTFHELAHSTGHASRLARKAVTETSFFGSADYGQEELVAEMTAAFLSGESGISPAVIDNQAAYLQGWLKAIKKDAKLLVFAAGQAQKAADYILGEGGERHEAAV